MSDRRIYADVPAEFGQLDTASIVLIPVPYDGTSTWIKGADRGPDAMLDAADNMELYDIETGTEVYRKGIYLADPVTESSSPEAMVDAVHQTARKYIDMGKYVTLFGGEHSISIGSIRAFRDRFPNLTVLQLDAHTDLRPEFHGTACNHACAVYESSRKDNLIQVGIRSMDIAEMEFLNQDKTFFAHEIAASEDKIWMQQVADLCTENVFLTIDLDVFDPAFMPGTGTPEPGGLSYYQVLNLIKIVMKKSNIVGFDIVELCPGDKPGPSDFLAAKLYYKLLSYQFAGK